ncbi:hypothetical protein [Falsibacillus pallidus]|uniref:Uncharacterized protein n=1 Tax=Falsibacillus pallidus TaxID=493781 RepID=A0A370GPV3_9BACI|nr:hypothetical protein [Falsibacillus pallidus]RDI45752.1 hypothetical protein DFR59_102385 [Falsibacillus pallidus]
MSDEKSFDLESLMNAASQLMKNDQLLENAVKLMADDGVLKSITDISSLKDSVGQVRETDSNNNAILQELKEMKSLLEEIKRRI